MTISNQVVKVLDMQEDHIEWRDIPQYSKYQASSTGLIRTKYKSVKTPAFHILIPSKKRKFKYICYTVTKDNGKRVSVYLHSLIVRAFHGEKPFDKAVTRHIDGNHLNNSPQNLVWGTQRENIQDSIKHGTFCNNNFGRNDEFPKFKKFRQEWKRLVSEGVTKKEIARLYGCHHTLIQKYTDDIY